MTITYIPAGHRIIVQLDPLKESKDGVKLNSTDKKLTSKTGFSLELPKETLERMEKEKLIDDSSINHGTVVAIGPNAWHGCHDSKPWAKLGDVVLFHRYCGIRPPEETGAERLQIIEDTDIIATIRRN